MDFANLTNDDVAVGIATIGIILIVLAVVNVRGIRRLRALVNEEDQLRRSLDEAADTWATLDMSLARERRKLNYVRTYVAKIDGTENTVYKKVVKELRGILDDEVERDECGNIK